MTYPGLTLVLAPVMNHRITPDMNFIKDQHSSQSRFSLGHPHSFLPDRGRLYSDLSNSDQ
jgi:hypothetical protein